MTGETEHIRRRYARRRANGAETRYHPLDPYVAATLRERQRALVRWIGRAGLAPVENKAVLEVGCGGGGNLLALIQLGFLPENLTANELLEDRAAVARHRLPQATRVVVGDAAELDLPDGSFDVVAQFTVFSSILDDALQAKLAGKMWALARPGGGILWYDFVYGNPANPDVRGVPLRRIRRLFPQGRHTAWRLTLAPPIGRLVARWAPWLHAPLHAVALLRTHVFCWIAKESPGPWAK